MTTLRCLDFEKMKFPTGILVQRSVHYQTDRCMKGRPQVGIITGFKVYLEDTPRFEECTRTKDELAAMSDADLMSAAYSVWADYCR